MKIEKFEELSIEMEAGTYEQNYKAIERTLFFSSFLGNAASIVFAFFFVNNIASTVHSYISGQQYILPVLIVIFLTAYELLKRFVFRRLAVNILTGKSKFTFKNLTGILFVLTLVAGSFYMSLNGARQVVDTTKYVKQNSDSTYVIQKKNIDSTYNSQIASLNTKIQFCYDNAKNRQSNWGLTKREYQQTTGWEADIKVLSTEKNKKLDDLKKGLDTNVDEQLVTVKSNMLTFFLLSSLIEILILIGVGFNAYYWYYSYNEYKLRITRNPNYKKYKLFSYLLTVLYQDGTKVIDDELPGVEGFAKMIEQHDSDATPQDARDFMNIAFQLGIIKQPNDKVKVAVIYSEGQDRIKRYLIIH